jgi:hypothetical protein
VVHQVLAIHCRGCVSSFQPPGAPPQHSERRHSFLSRLQVLKDVEQLKEPGNWTFLLLLAQHPAAVDHAESSNLPG